MKKYYQKALPVLILSASLFYGCQDDLSNKDGQLIRQVHEDYVNGWLTMDEEKVMGLLIENSRIQPNSMKPIEGKSAIRNFWFPNDGSQTTINDYQTEIISLNILDSIAVTSHTSRLVWTYKKDSVQFGMLQEGINTTLYKKQANGNWKIWRSMWTDIHIENK